MHLTGPAAGQPTLPGGGADGFSAIHPRLIAFAVRARSIAMLMLSCLAMASLVNEARAISGISVNYDVPGSTPLMLPSEVAGVVPLVNWNNVSSTNTGGLTAPTQTFHNNSGIDISGFTVTLSSSLGSSWNTTGTGDKKLFGDWALSGGGTLTLVNIPYTTYDIYVYFMGFGGNDTVNYTIGSDTQTLVEAGTTPGTFASHVQNQTYVKFTGLSGSSQTMTVTGVSGGESGVAAIQIVQTSASTYSILPSAGAHGSISPSTLQTVNSGSDSTFTITPDAGYVIYRVLVDGTNNPAAVTSGTYTFTNVSDDHTITASFVSETTDLHLQVDLQASSLALGSNLGSWPNAGLLGGSFDKYSGGTGPDVVTILGKKAVQFVQPDNTANSRRTLASAIPAPTSLSGNNPWTISTLLYRSSSQPAGENSYAQWSGGSYSTGQSAIFRYTANGAYMHGSSDSGFQTVPSANAWHNVTITFDGATETIYVDGVVDRSDARTLGILPGGLMMVGSRTYHDSWIEDQHWRFNGAIASLKIYDRALSASEVQALVTVPTQTITASAGAGGTISPSGANIVDVGDSPTFNIIPNLGYAVSDVMVDGISIGAVASYTFTNVTTDHTIAASFTALPSQLVTGKVTDGSAGLMGATVYFKLSAPAYVYPIYTTTTTNAAGDFSISLPPANWHVSASKDGYDYAADSTFTVDSSPVVLPNIVLVTNPTWDVLFTLNTDELLGMANGDRINTWGGLTAMTTYNNGQPLLGPVVETIGTNNWERNTRAAYDGTVSPPIADRGDGFQFLSQFTNAIPVNGASIVTIIKPIRNSLVSSWTSIVDLFYDRMMLGIKSATGELLIWRNGGFLNSGVFIPDGQTTILSMVVQPTGEYKVWVNGLQVIDRTTTSDMTYLVPGADLYKKFIHIGRNHNDGWSTFNGNIGDVYVFKRAIPDSKRTELQNALSAKFATPIPVYTTISGKVTLPDGITPVAGATVSAVGTSATVTNLTAIDGTYSLTVEGSANYSVSATAESFTTSTPVNVPVGSSAVTGVNLTISPINAIQGVVKTVSGTPIYNAVVQVGGPGYPAAVTDLNGHYLVTGIQAIEGLEVYADAVGFADNTQNIDGTPAASGVITLDITLTNKAEAGVVINGGLEAWGSDGLPSDWGIFGGTSVTISKSTNKFSGSYSAFVTATAQYSFLAASVDVIPGSSYNCYFKLKADPGVTQCFPMPAFRNAAGQEAPAFVSAEPGHSGYVHAPTTNWMQYLHFNNGVGMPFVRFTAPEDATKLNVIFGFETLPPAGKGIYIDDLVIDRVGPDVSMPPQPVLPANAVSMSGGAPTLTFPTVAGFRYRVVYKNSLSDSGWTAVPPGFVMSSGEDMVVTDSTSSGNPQRFYRIEAAP